MKYIVQVQLPDTLTNIQYKCDNSEMAWRKAHACLATYVRERCIIDIYRFQGQNMKLIAHLENEEG